MAEKPTMDLARLDRRRLLQLALAATAASSFISVRQGLAAGEATARTRFIDVHAHIFNGADLPTSRFLDIVVLEHFPEQFVPKDFAGDAVSSVLGSAVKAIAEMIKWRAPGPEAEIALLNQKKSDDGLPEIVAKSAAEQDSEDAEIIDQLLHDYAKRRSGQEPTTFFKGDEWKEQIRQLDPLFNHLAGQSRLKSEAVPAHQLFLEKSARDEVSKEVDTGNIDVGSLLAWGALLTRYRHEIFDRYLTTYSGSTRKPALVAPALVDFSHWLDDTQASDQTRQVEVTALVAQRARGTMLHGYAAFDPLREVIARDDHKPGPLDLAKRAVEKEGFIGVKLYSPMGFRPTGNATSDDKYPAAPSSIPNLRAKLDAALDDLYAWTSKSGVAILAHTANSQQANTGYGCRAAPHFWLKVFEKYPDVRLCLAHFGDFGLRQNCAEAPYQVPAGTWEDEIGKVVKAAKNPNVYADLSYFEPAFRSGQQLTEGDAKVSRKLKAWVDAYDPGCTHLLFGTDWSMIRKEPGQEGYVVNMERFMRGAGLNDAAIDNFFFNNAVRFLGLHAGEANRKRLEAFYSAHTMDVQRLAVFNGVA